MSLKTFVVLVGLGVVVTVVIVGSRSAPPESSAPLCTEASCSLGEAAETPAEDSENAFTLASQTNAEGDVEVTVSPLFDERSSSLQFEIELETHTVELDLDLVQASVLKDEQGNVYQPFQWDGDPPGGHHRSGVLNFGMLGRQVQTLELVIAGIGGTPPRQFLWTISDIIK